MYQHIRWNTQRSAGGSTPVKQTTRCHQTDRATKLTGGHVASLAQQCFSRSCEIGCSLERTGEKSTDSWSRCAWRAGWAVERAATCWCSSGCGSAGACRETGPPGLYQGQCTSQTCPSTTVCIKTRSYEQPMAAGSETPAGLRWRRSAATPSGWRCPLLRAWRREECK